MVIDTMSSLEGVERNQGTAGEHRPDPELATAIERGVVSPSTLPGALLASCMIKVETTSRELVRAVTAPSHTACPLSRRIPT